MRPSLLIAAAALAALSAPLAAATLEKTAAMVIQTTSSTEVGLALPPPSTVGDTAVRAYSGNFACTFRYDAATLEVTGFEFGAGEVLAAGYVLEFGTIVTYPSPYGQRATYILRQPAAVPAVTRFRPQTPTPPGAIAPDGTLVNAQHRWRADYGTEVTGRTVSGSNQPTLTVNYTAFPVNLPFKGTATPVVQELSRTLHERTLQATLTLELDEQQTITLPGSVPGLDLEVIESESGTITAKTASFKSPTDYALWAGDNGLTKPDPEAENPAGIPLGILFALDLPVSATSLPIAVRLAGDLPLVRITLPAGGLRHDLTVQYSADPSGGAWADLDPAYYFDGPGSLDRGSTGAPRFLFPDGDAGFLRFVAVLE